MRLTPQQLSEAAGATVPDVIGPGVRLVFCGINPGLWTAAAQQHFGRPGNRFWKVLHLAGFTASQLDPADQHLLIAEGMGITNLVARASASAAELSTAELREGAARLAEAVEEWGVGWVALLGMGAYRSAFGRPKAGLGEQPERLGPARLWLLPNPSGLQARYQLPELVELFSELREAVSAQG